MREGESHAGKNKGIEKVFEIRFCGGIRRYADVLCGMQESIFNTFVSILFLFFIY